MMNHKIHSIAAIGEKTRVIGDSGAIPWHIPADFKRFKEMTLGHPIIMGRKTFESIGRVLPGRTNIIITRGDSNYEGALVAHSIEEAIEIAKEQEGSEDIYIIGGGSIYTEGLKYTDELNLTLISGDFDGDAFFPPYEELFTKEIFREEHKDEEVPYVFLDLVKE